MRNYKALAGSLSRINTIHDLKNQGYAYHHTACRRGYTRVLECGIPQPYKGKFGVGYIVPMGRHAVNGRLSTQYEDIAYYVK